MTTSYIKDKATGNILASTSGQDENNPHHLTAVENFVTSRGWDLADYEIGFAEQSVVDDMIASAVTPLEKWKQKMVVSDGPLPRWAEDLVDGAISSQTQKLADDKKALRSEKP